MSDYRNLTFALFLCVVAAFSAGVWVVGWLWPKPPPETRRECLAHTVAQIQRCLDLGGGEPILVRLDAGKTYLLDKPLTVWPNMELRGDMSDPPIPMRGAIPK